jgi:hypothetical protein
VKGFFSETQRPEVFESRSYPGQRLRFVKNLTTANQPMSYTGDGLLRKESAGWNSPGRSPSAGQWKDRAIDQDP